MERFLMHLGSMLVRIDVSDPTLAVLLDRGSSQVSDGSAASSQESFRSYSFKRSFMNNESSLLLLPVT